ncbi:putative minor capsid protein [Adlercreutzia aquisgranensis]|uniref:putative minor capsid protein n=1 Tax=Adlercreutzia aquisgranensis TaxID=2941323 RepID=UPI002041FCA9|nr:putative minor capsid protein [Adlercreutzia aquisgranensis]
MMRGLRPIPLRLLADDAVVRVPDGAGGYAEGVAVSHVRFGRTQSVVDDGHRSADAGSGKVYVDAINSGGAFEVPAGSCIDFDGHSYYVAECRRCEGFNGHVHHWELGVR